MAIESFQIDPSAGNPTGDQVVALINGATDPITRAASVSAAARPIEDEEVSAAKLAGGVAKTNLDSMADTARGYIQTNPQSGEKPIIAMQRDASGFLDIEKDDQAV